MQLTIHGTALLFFIVGQCYRAVRGWSRKRSANERVSIRGQFTFTRFDSFAQIAFEVLFFPLFQQERFV